MKIQSTSIAFAALKSRIEKKLSERPTFRTTTGAVVEFTKGHVLRIKQNIPDLSFERPNQIKVSHPFLKDPWTIRFPHALEKYFPYKG